MRLLLASVALAESVKEDVRAAAASIAPLTHYIPKRLWYEMLEGYSTDLRFEHKDVHKRTRLITMDDLVEYSQCVAGVVGEMCTRVILGRCGLAVPLDLHVDRKIVLGGIPADGRDDKSSSLAGGAPAATLDLSKAADMHALLYEARRMGVSLQLVNIARDVVPDALELRRCYLPADLFDEADGGMQEALLHGRLNVPKRSAAAAGKAGKSKAEEAEAVQAVQAAQAAVEPREVRKYALRLLAMSRRLYDQAYPALGQIPNRPARAGLKAACAVYAAIGTKIEAQNADDMASGRRARMSNWDRIVRAVAAVYFGV
ncbi:hypothetical protein L1887_56993 [Cichorium endivia]|nr:hypothetical protein L1887_56993 [Cichorium endivia]